MKVKRVLIDLERLRYPNSGIANVFKNLALGLDTFKKDIAIFYYCERNTVVSLSDKKEQILERKFWDKKSSFFYKKFELFHVSHQLTSYLKKKRQGQKKIVTLHDLNFLHEDLKEKKKEKLKTLVNKNISNADVIVCISNFVKEDLERNWSLFDFTSNPDVKMVYNGLNFDQIDASSKRLGKYDFLKKKSFILNIGVLFPKKNQLSLVKMMPYIEEDLVLVVSDSKPEYEELILEEVKKNNCEDRLHIVRDITNEEKFGLLESCIALLHPSLAEGFGIPPIEAMYFEKPVFLSKHTSLPEIGGEVAFYFDSFDTDTMVQNYQKGMQTYFHETGYGKRLKDRAFYFNNKRMAKEYYAIYNSLLNEL